MPTIQDQEFGTISIRRGARSRSISIRPAPDGGLRVSAPMYTPIVYIKRVLERSRPKLRQIVSEQSTIVEFAHGMQLGRSHTLIVIENSSEISVKRQQRQLIVEIPHNATLDAAEIRPLIQQEYKKILKLEAKSYLPRRLFALSTKSGYKYTKVRYSHASGRWGSCSSNGTISLNIALMKLRHELIDYVLIHELCHTVQMNHSQAFWSLVAEHCPDYKALRAELKQQHPYV